MTPPNNVQHKIVIPDFKGSLFAAGTPHIKLVADTANLLLQNGGKKE